MLGTSVRGFDVPPLALEPARRMCLDLRRLIQSRRMESCLVGSGCPNYFLTLFFASQPAMNCVKKGGEG